MQNTVVLKEVQSSILTSPPLKYKRTKTKNSIQNKLESLDMFNCHNIANQLTSCNLVCSVKYEIVTFYTFFTVSGAKC